MTVSKQGIGLILSAIDDTVQRMADSPTAEDKLYFFSVVQGTINRVMNFECDPLLVFAHQVLVSVHQSLVNRLNQSRTPMPATFKSLPDAMVEALTTYLWDLRQDLEAGEEDAIRMDLQRFANLSYATSGNGFYLYLTGKLTL